MGLRNCERCGRLFSGTDSVCPDCYERERDEFDRVREYLARHRGATVAEVSSQTGVSIQRIHRWAREGRLQVTQEQLGAALRCERCGVPIDGGRFCPRCLSELASEIRRASAGRAGGHEGAGAVEAPAPPVRSGEGQEPPVAPGERHRVKVHVIDHVRRRRAR